MGAGGKIDTLLILSQQGHVGLVGTEGNACGRRQRSTGVNQVGREEADFIGCANGTWKKKYFFLLLHFTYRCYKFPEPLAAVIVEALVHFLGVVGEVRPVLGHNGLKF